MFRNLAIILFLTFCVKVYPQTIPGHSLLPPADRSTLQQLNKITEHTKTLRALQKELKRVNKERTKDSIRYLKKVKKFAKDSVKSLSRQEKDTIQKKTYVRNILAGHLNDRYIPTVLKVPYTQWQSTRAKYKRYQGLLDSLDQVKLPDKDSLLSSLPKALEKMAENELKQYCKQLDGNELIDHQLGAFRTAGEDVGSQSESIGQEDVQRSIRTLKNHFSGHTKEIHNVEEQLGKYRKKYKDVQSVKELAKDPPNPLHDKTFGERLWFGLNISPFKAETFITDLSPFVGYRLNTHFSTGLALFYRVNFSDEKVSTFQDMAHRAQGFRYFFQYQLKSGFFAHLEFEQANTRTFDPSVDNYRKEWVPALLLGPGKTFKLSKRIKGQASVLYNFLYQKNPESMPQAVNIRFGFRIDQR